MIAHPAVYALIAVTGVALVGWQIYEHYQEQRMYEQYQRHRARYEREFSYEQQYNRFHRNNNEFDFDDDNDDDDNDNYIRKRKPFTDDTDTEKKKSSIQEEQDQYELSDLETSIAERKRRLMAEQAFLDQEEENLRNRRETIMRNSTGAISSSSTRSIISVNSGSSSSDSDGDEHKSQSHMANFDPFVDHFQENNSGISITSSPKYSMAESSIHEESNNSDSTETIHVENNRPPASLDNSTELFYPSASLLTPSTSTTTSVSGENMNSPNINRVSDSEESWDAVSENEWNQSSINDSDNELSSRFSIASLSDDEIRIRF